MEQYSGQKQADQFNNDNRTYYFTRKAATMADTRRLPGPNADVWDWQLEGSCRGMDSAFFFHPDGERGPARARREAIAKAICQGCPVLQLCRAHALAAHEPYGVWGGLSESERENIIKNRNSRAPEPALAGH